MGGDWDAIVIGAGHNGLAAARVLVQRGFRVLVLEKNRYVGGMAGTVGRFLKAISAVCAANCAASASLP